MALCLLKLYLSTDIEFTLLYVEGMPQCCGPETQRNSWIFSDAPH